MKILNVDFWKRVLDEEEKKAQQPKFLTGRQIARVILEHCQDQRHGRNSVGFLRPAESRNLQSKWDEAIIAMRKHPERDLGESVLQAVRKI